MNDMKQLERLISASVSPYHCIMTAAASLDGAGFTELSLSGSWKLEQGHSYYIKAYDSTLIAFTIGELADQTPKLKLAYGLALSEIKAFSRGNFRTVRKTQHRGLRRTASSHLV